MPGYRIELIELLENQLQRSPKSLLKEQIARLHDLTIFECEDGETYPYREICEKVTEYRPQQGGQARLEGRDLRADLSKLLLTLSKLADLRPKDSPEPVYSLSAVCDTYDVNSKMVFGWLNRGLVGMEYRWGGRRRMPGFRFSALRRFEEENPGLVGRHTLFALIPSRDRAQIVRQAKRHLGEQEADLDDITQQVSTELGKAPQLVRFVLRKHAENNPESPLARDIPPALSGQDKVDITTAYQQGATLPALTRKYKRSLRAIYFIICQQQAEEILAQPVSFMHNPLFDKPNAQAIIMSGEKLDTRTRAQEVLGRSKRYDETPLYLLEIKNQTLLTKAQEIDLFRRYNFLKYRISGLREELQNSKASASLIRHIRSLQSQADACRATLVKSNLRLVVSIAKRHLRSGMGMETLIADGNLSLMQAIEKFDYARGNRFSTYASWALIKNYAKRIPAETGHAHNFITGASALIEQLDARPVGGHGREGLEKSVAALLDRLDSREREIIVSRFGLQEDQPPQTLEQVGRRLTLSKERIRQIENQALEKLRAFLES